jgi:allantoin racemase
MTVVVINPNSSEKMTEDIRKTALAYAGGRFDVKVLSARNSPGFISTFKDEALAIPGTLELIREYGREADVFVLACGRDPFIDLLREATDKPVVGIAQASMFYASMLGRSFTVLQTPEYSIPNKKKVVDSYHMEHFLASVRAPRAGQENTYEVYLNVAREALKNDGAEVIVLGCAGMCTIAGKLAEDLQVPVLDGVACGLAMAEGLLHTGYKTSKVRFYAGGHP